MPSLKFKIQLIVTIFIASITAADLLESNNVGLSGVETSCSCAVIGGFQSTLLVSVFFVVSQFSPLFLLAAVKHANPYN